MFHSLDVFPQFLTFVRSISHHRVGFTTARLAIREQCTVIPWPGVVQQSRTKVSKHVILKRKERNYESITSSSSSRSLTRPVQQQWWSWWSSSGPPSPHIISGEVELMKATVRFALVGVCYIITRLKYYLNIGLYVELLKLKNENGKTDMNSVYL